MNKRSFKIPLEGAKELFGEVMFFANHIHLDELRADNIRRVTSSQSIGWAFTTILESDRPHLTCYEREGYGAMNEPYFEFAMSTMGAHSPEYIMWIHVPIDAALAIIEKYKLVPR